MSIADLSVVSKHDQPPGRDTNGPVIERALAWGATIHKENGEKVVLRLPNGEKLTLYAAGYHKGNSTHTLQALFKHFGGSRHGFWCNDTPKLPEPETATVSAHAFDLDALSHAEQLAEVQVWLQEDHARRGATVEFELLRDRAAKDRGIGETLLLEALHANGIAVIDHDGRRYLRKERRQTERTVLSSEIVEATPPAKPELHVVPPIEEAPVAPSVQAEVTKMRREVADLTAKVKAKQAKQAKQAKVKPLGHPPAPHTLHAVRHMLEHEGDVFTSADLTEVTGYKAIGTRLQLHAREGRLVRLPGGKGKPNLWGIDEVTAPEARAWLQSHGIDLDAPQATTPQDTQEHPVSQPAPQPEPTPAKAPKKKFSIEAQVAAWLIARRPGREFSTKMVADGARLKGPQATGALARLATKNLIENRGYQGLGSGSYVYYALLEEQVPFLVGFLRNEGVLDPVIWQPKAPKALRPVPDAVTPQEAPSAPAPTPEASPAAEAAPAAVSEDVEVTLPTAEYTVSHDGSITLRGAASSYFGDPAIIASPTYQRLAENTDRLEARNDWLQEERTRLEVRLDELQTELNSIQLDVVAARQARAAEAPVLTWAETIHAGVRQGLDGVHPSFDESAKIIEERDRLVLDIEIVQHREQRP